MPSLSIRNLDDDVVRRLKQRAARHARSTEAEIREILRQAVAEEPETSFVALAARMRAMLSGRTHSASQDLIRAGRDDR